MTGFRSVFKFGRRNLVLREIFPFASFFLFFFICHPFIIFTIQILTLITNIKQLLTLLSFLRDDQRRLSFITYATLFRENSGSTLQTEERNLRESGNLENKR